MKLLNLIFMAFLLVACGETEEDIQDIDKKNNERAGTISHDDKYKLDIDGDRNVYRLEDKIEEVEITGDENYITIVSDAMIDSLIITGNRNVVDTEDDHDSTIVDVEINGSNNVVKLYDIANLTVDGQANQVQQSVDQ